MLRGTAGNGQSGPSPLAGCSGDGPDCPEPPSVREGDARRRGFSRPAARPASALHALHDELAYALGVGLAAGLPPAGEIAATLAEHGFIVNAPRPDTIRLAPPFILSDADADAFTGALSEVLARRLQRGAP